MAASDWRRRGGALERWRSFRLKLIGLQEAWGRLAPRRQSDGRARPSWRLITRTRCAAAAGAARRAPGERRATRGDDARTQLLQRRQTLRARATGGPAAPLRRSRHCGRDNEVAPLAIVTLNIITFQALVAYYSKRHIGAACLSCTRSNNAIHLDKRTGPELGCEVSERVAAS